MGDILIGDTSPAERQFPSKQFVKTQPLVTHIHTHTYTPTPNTVSTALPGSDQK